MKKPRRPRRTAPATAADLQAARAHLKVLGSPYATQLATLLAHLEEKGDRILLEGAREGLELSRTRPSAQRLSEQLAAFTDAVDRVNPATPVPERTLQMARLAERWLRADEALARQAERLHRQALAADAARGQRFRQGRGRGKVAWHAEVQKLADANPTASFQDIWHVIGREANPAKTITLRASDNKTLECKEVVGRPCVEGHHIHWRASADDDDPPPPLRSASKATLATFVSRRSPRRAR